jgi:His-Xaa-Ser system protein HxsD
MSSNNPPPGADVRVSIRLDKSLISIEAILKTCYWFTRNFSYAIEELSGAEVVVSLVPRNSLLVDPSIEADFIAQATDFALRERIETQTSGVRDLLLAKAFSEAGVLEDPPQGAFGDRIEEEKPNGLFKILSNA